MRFGKSVLSQHLRTGCDLNLYLTLNTPIERRQKNLPQPIKSRPSVESLKQAGIDFENGINRLLSRHLKGRCVHAQRKAGSDALPFIEMHEALARFDAMELPAIILQPKMELEPGGKDALRRLGVAAASLGSMPELDGIIPDVLIAEKPSPGAYEVLPNAERWPIGADDERTGLLVVDVKHARDPNPSYSAEVVLYAVMLANWLEHHGLRDRFLVIAETFLWTRGGMARGNLHRALDVDDPDQDAIIEAIGYDLEPINTPIYLQAIRRFLTEQIPDVIARGDADWRSLDWAVGPACGSCDWLAYPNYLTREQKKIVDDNPKGYCLRRAGLVDHLSRMPRLTKGARGVMRSAGLDTVAQIAVMSGTEDVYGRHNRLQAERLALPAYARAITCGQPEVDAERRDGLLAYYAHLTIFVTVNFDVGSGLVTGIGAHVRFNQPTPYVESLPDVEERSRVGGIFRFGHWVTTGKSTESEEAMLFGFLQFVAHAVEHAHDTDAQRGGPLAGTTGTQVVFWSDREFEELCLAMGRHLQTVLLDKNATRILKSLAWLFPPEELQQRENGQPASPVIAYVQRTLNRLVRTPSEHALTLFRVAEHYRHVSDRTPAWRPPDTFYTEPFSDGVPRERIYEIWQLTDAGGRGVANWGSVRKSLSELISGYEDALHKQVSTLADVTVRLRKDFKDRLRAHAPRLDLSIPRWMQRAAPDTKLMAAWAAFDRAYGQNRSFRRYFMDPEEIEASHEGIRLVRYIGSHPGSIHEYEISQGSANTKLKAPDAYLRVTFNDVPGFLTLRIWEILPKGTYAPDKGGLSMHHVFQAELVDLDRAGRVARIRLSDNQDHRELRRKVLAALGLNARSDMTLLENLGSSAIVDRLQTILREIGNPAIAQAAPETSRALGKERNFPRGRDPVTPPARVLWDAAALATEPFRSEAEALAIAHVARDLNSSQIDAVSQAARWRLTPLWGPPGTGKTETATAFVHGTIRLEAARPGKTGFAILLTGPNYKAVAELAGRVVRSLDGDPSAACRVYFVRPEARAADLALPDALNAHLNGTHMEAEAADPALPFLVADLDRPGVTLVATVVHQCPKIAQSTGWIRDEGNGLVRELFDLVLIDESSQVDMAIAAGPIALLKERSQLVVAGDHLQMPPVVQADPPVGAEHLVGSVQTYLTKRFGLPTRNLLQNYRSHADIVAYTKRLGYPQGLTASNPDTALNWRLPVRDSIAAATGIASDAWEELLDPGRPIVALTYPDGMSGQANPFEAACIATLARALFLGTSCGLDGRSPPQPHGSWEAAAFWESGVGVVTPHRAQRAQVLSALAQAFPEVDPILMEGAVDTVERFQGGQRHTILISFGLGDPDIIGGEERFLLQLERTNVALSRAMAKCILVMSEEMAGHLPADHKAAEGAHVLRGIVDEWCNRSRVTNAYLSDGSIRRVRPRWRV